jgi:hypothetical protein
MIGKNRCWRCGVALMVESVLCSACVLFASAAPHADPGHVPHAEPIPAVALVHPDENPHSPDDLDGLFSASAGVEAAGGGAAVQGAATLQGQGSLTAGGTAARTGAASISGAGGLSAG